MIQSILDSGINIKMVFDSGVEIGDFPNETLCKNIRLIQLYGIHYLGKELHNFDFLFHANCFSVIDGFIEEGLFSVVKDHAEYIKSDNQNAIKRIHISNLIGSEVVKGKRLDSRLLYEKRYFMSDKELDSFCCSHVREFDNSLIKDIFNKSDANYISDDILSSDTVKRIDREYLVDGVYLFGDTIISRFKFLRYYEIIRDNVDFCEEDKVFNSLIYSSLLTDEELSLIQKSVENIKNQLTFVKK